MRFVPTSLHRCLLALPTLLATGLLATAAQAVSPLRQLDVVLLQPGDTLERRVGGADALADYVKAVGEVTEKTVTRHPEQIPASGFIVVAVRPGPQSHAWLDFKPALADATAHDLLDAVQSAPPPSVRGGPVVFALRVSLWGAKAPAAYAPAPEAWRTAARQAGHPLDMDTLIDAVWPGEAAR